MNAKVQFPEVFGFLFEPARYKVGKGGRYGLKSWSYADALLMICANPSMLWKGRTEPVRILCARETQKSIAESVHQLLEDQIKRLNLTRYFNVTKSEILCVNGPGAGGFFSFAGIRQNVENIKSYEGYDIAWVEEANRVTRNSWNVLIPTIRKEGSEIWVSYNPDLETDETHQRFAINPPTNAVIVHTTWRDNPWVTDVILQEIEDLKKRSEDDYLNVYEGVCKQAVEGAIYKEEIAIAEKANRFTRVPYDASQPVYTFWDLGFGDNTSIWFAQSFPFEFRIIDHLSASLKGLQYYVKQLQEKPYSYAKHWLPHDGKAHELGTGKSIEEQLQAVFGLERVQCAPRLDVEDGISAVRAIFPQCFFDRENCADGIQSLRHYRYEYDEELRTFQRKPLHDWASHDADAFRTLAVAIKLQERPKPKSEGPPRTNWYPAQQQSSAWMR